MKISNIHLAYFSATFTTKNIATQFTSNLGPETKQYDITQYPPIEKIQINSCDDLFVIAIPVYAGRIPKTALSAINKFKGKGTPAVIICVYGNRDFDDALLELHNIVENNGFKVISAAAFIAQHSIFPKVGKGRPDNKDIEEISNFSKQTANLISQITDISSIPELKVNGNHPYKVPGRIPIHPVGNKECQNCGICVKECPANAIPAKEPYKTDSSKCISCGRCIVVCPRNCRSYKGLLYKIASWKFKKKNSLRKEPETFFIDIK